MEGSINSLKVALVEVLRATSVERSRGKVKITEGVVVSGVAAVVKLHA